ncbi:MAG: hypothetical protein ACI81V_000322 [Lentimonas sp.]|jgi:hypothetical protein
MKKIISLLSIIALGQGAQAAAGFQASLTPDIAIVDQGAAVKGLALNVWGDNQVRGVDIGFVNQQSGDSMGFTWSFLGGTVENYKGVIWGGFYTRATGDVVGWQSAMVNINDGSLTGLQSGLVNIAQDVTGVQLGLVNYTKRLNGVQIGLANIVERNSWFQDFPEELAKGFPFVNWSF